MGTTASLTVLPKLGRLTQRWTTRRHESFTGTNRRERQPGIEGDFYGVRPWQHGDSVRLIHWRTTARAGELVVRQFEQPRSRDLAILLDLWKPDQPKREHEENIELAVSFAATILNDACRKGANDVYLILADLQPRMTGGPASPVMLQDAMERLALAEAQHRDYTPQLFELLFSRISPGMEVVLLSTRPVDLADPARWGRIEADPAHRAVLRRTRVIDTSSPELGNYFQPE
jgi:uncharacterized protein (DUF58 family)